MRRERSMFRVAVGLVVTATVVLGIGLSSVEAETINLTPQTDNWISSCSSGCTVNNGVSNEIRVRTSWWGSTGNREVKNFRTLLQLDLAALPDDADLITNATLGFYYFNRPHADPVGRSYEARRVINSWDEANSTWQARDDYNGMAPVYWDSYNAGTPAYQPGGVDFAATVYDTDVVPTALNSWMTWDVTSLVKQWVAGDYANHGLLIMDNSEITSDPGGDSISYHARFRSREYNTDVSQRPYLAVTVVPEPATMLLLSMGLLGSALVRRKGLK